MKPLKDDPLWIRLSQYIVDLERFARIHGWHTPDELVGSIQKIEERFVAHNPQPGAGVKKP